MTTTAHEDQYTVAPEPVRQPYDTASILRRNVADLELALRTQTERAEAAEEELLAVREDMQSWIDSRNGWMERAGAAEAELARLREQKPVRWHVRGNYFRDGDAAILFASMNAVHGAKVEQLYAAPAPAPAMPTDEQIHAAYRVALGQSIRERDMPEIRKFAIALLQSAEVTK